MDIEKNVYKLFKKYKTNCPFQLAKLLNIHIRYLDLPEGVRGYYFRTLRRRFIAISTNIPEQLQRFTCAHELGHDRLHKGLGFYFIEQHSLFNPGKFERQANNFAVHLLISGSSPYDGETIDSFYLRNGIPKEIIGKI